MNVIQKPELIAQRDEIPGIVEQSCGRKYLTYLESVHAILMLLFTAWQRYTDNNIPDQIDSGLKERIRMF